LDFRQKSTSRDTGSGTVEKLVPENMGIAVGILLLCALELEIRLGGQNTQLPANVAKKLSPRQGLIDFTSVIIKFFVTGVTTYYFLGI